MAYDRSVKQPIQYAGFPGGVNRRGQELKLPETDLRTALNVDIAQDGTVKRRRGYNRVIDGDCHSIWSDPDIDYGLLVRNGDLCRINVPGFETPVLLAGVGGDRMSFALFNDWVFFSNGAVSGRIVNDAVQPWGMPQATMPVIESTTVGGLLGGRYQVAVTWVDDSGEEGGCELPQLVDVPSGGGIQLTQINHGIYPIVRVYVSPHDGDMLYAAADITTGFTTFVIGEHEPGTALRQWNTAPLPAGHIVRSFKGRMYVARENYLFFSLPMHPGLYNRAEGYIDFGSRINLVEVADDGVYVATQSHTLFMLGNDPEDWSPKRVSNRGAIPGTSAQVPAHAFGNPEAAFFGYVACWQDTDGALTVGYSQGQVRRVNAEKVGNTGFLYGATSYTEHQGIRQVFSVMRNRTPNTQGMVTDSAVADVKKNRIVHDDAFEFYLVELEGYALELEGYAVSLQPDP